MYMFNKGAISQTFIASLNVYRTHCELDTGSDLQMGTESDHERDPPSDCDLDLPSDHERDPPSDSDLDLPCDSDCDAQSDPELDVQIDQDIFEPVYPGASITVCGAYCAIMEFKRVCRLPCTAITMLLQLLQLLCPIQNKLPRSVYMLNIHVFSNTEVHTQRLFCGTCNKEFQQGQKRGPDANCPQQERNTLVHNYSF